MTRDKPDMDGSPGFPGWTWFSVVLALCLGALVLAASITAFYMSGDRYVHRMTLHWPGTSLTPAAGEPEYRDGGLVIGTLRARQRFGVQLPHHGISAAQYSQLQLHMAADSGRVRYELVWSDPGGAGNVRGVHLPPVAPGKQTIDLTARAGWQGEIHRLFLFADGPIDDPVTLHDVRLLPAAPSMAALLRQVWKEWTTFEGWRGHSINFIAGGARTQLVSPVLAAALWIVLSGLFYTLWMTTLGRRPSLVALGVILLAGWLALDLRWQVDLMRQVQATAARYAGKDPSEKRLAGEDRDLYRFAHEVKSLLPDPARARVFVIVSEVLGSEKYLRARMPYLLLPHNVGSSWTEPPPMEFLRQGDHLLILRPHPGVEFDPHGKRVLWGGDRTLAVERLLAHPTGDLYRVSLGRVQTDISTPDPALPADP